MGIADLLTAVVAADHRITLTHYDTDFDTAAEAVTFRHRWVATPGSID